MKNKVYLSKRVCKDGYPPHTPVTLISATGEEIDGYLTDSQLARIITRAYAAGKVRTPKKNIVKRIFGF